MDEATLKDHLAWYANFLLKVHKWAAAPKSLKARELLEEHEALILDAEIDRLGRHLAHEAASRTPLRASGGYSEAGILAAAAEIVYVVGRAHMGAFAEAVGGDLLRMAEGRGSLLAVKIPQSKHPYGDIIDDVTEWMILQADYLAERNGGSWVDKVTYQMVQKRTLQVWAAKIPPAKRQEARLIGSLEARQAALSPDQQAFRDKFMHYTMDELAYMLGHSPGTA